MLGHITYSSYYRGLSYLDGASKTYVLLNGQVLQRSDFSSLSTYFPTGTYGSTETHIVLPDVASSYWRGADIGRGADVDKAARIATSGTDPTGDTLGAFQLGELGSHTHPSGNIVQNSPIPVAGNGAQGAYQIPSSFTTGAPFFQNSSGILVSGTVSSAFDVGSVSYFAYLGVD